VAGLAGRATILCAWTGSKAFAQYGARVGALVAVTEDAEERRRIKNALGYSCRGTWSNCNHLGMLAVTELLTDPLLRARADAEREGLRRLLSERVEEFNHRAHAAGLSFPRYEGGFFVAVFTPDAKRTVARMQQDGVFVVPLTGAVRVALCATPRASIARLVDSLAAGVAAAAP
jgi:aromatic-amino-acid transaminase